LSQSTTKLTSLSNLLRPRIGGLSIKESCEAGQRVRLMLSLSLTTGRGLIRLTLKEVHGAVHGAVSEAVSEAVHGAVPGQCPREIVCNN